MAIAYWAFAGITFAFVLQAFLNDFVANKLDTEAWLFISVASLLWPITLPFVIRSKFKSTAKSRRLSRVRVSTPNSAPMTGDF